MPCEGCGFPLSHRHHIIEFAEHGEHCLTMPLCPTCHWILHICIRAHVYHSERAGKLWTHLLGTPGTMARLAWARRKVDEYMETLFDSLCVSPRSGVSGGR